MYDVIVFGATFFAVGIASQLGDKCLIVEKRPSAGYEFISALSFGTSYDKELKTDEAKALQKTYEERNFITENRVCLFPCSAPFYKLLENKNVLLNTEIVSAEKKEDYFVCTTYGVSGYKTFEAKKIIDTRENENICVSKTFNLLIDGDTSELSSDIAYEKWGFENQYVIKMPVSVDASYFEARREAKKIIENLPVSHKLVLSADTFDYEIKKDCITAELQPSKSFDNPLLSFDAGVTLGKELCDATF